MNRAHIFQEIGHFAKILTRVLVFFYLPICFIGTVARYPHDTDASYNPSSLTKSDSFYDAAYSQKKNRGIDYEDFARRAAEQVGIIEVVQRFVQDYHLSDKRILDVGSGRGYLQDVVRDYTGLDISKSVSKHYHKPFVVGSATAMPFADNSFDAVWSIWVLEHVPQPEKALLEIRRVLRPGGVALLFPAWDCSPWAADGFDARPYSDFNWRGKLVKASIVPWRCYFYALRMPVRAIRWAQYDLGTDALRYRRLQPNYNVYWEADSDAAVSLDRFEVYLWFRARGDDCMNCRGVSQEFRNEYGKLVLRIKK